MEDVVKVKHNPVLDLKFLQSKVSALQEFDPAFWALDI